MDRIVSDRSSFCFSRYSNLVGIYQIEFFFRLVFAFISFIWLMHRKCWQLLNFFNVKKGFRQFFWGLYKILQWNKCFQCQYEAEYSKLNFFHQFSTFLPLLLLTPVPLLVMKLQNSFLTSIFHQKRLLLKQFNENNKKFVKQTDIHTGHSHT